MEYLVLDVGGSAIKYALMNDELEFLEKGQVPTPKTSLEDFKKEVQNLYQKYQERVDGIAMSLPGLINKKTNKMQIPGALLYNQDVDILKELKSVTTDRLTIENDAKCAALCEVVYGSLKDSQVGAVCIIGTGIGGGVTIGDKVFTGVHGFAGEFSYLSIDWKKNLGFENKWGTDFGAFTLVEMIAKAKGLVEEIDGVQAFEYCNQGDKDALKALEEFCNITAIGLYNLQAVIDPDKIAIGGGISKQPILLEYLQKSLDKIYQSIDVPIPQVNIVRCKYDNDSNLIGALANYKKIYNC